MSELSQDATYRDMPDVFARLAALREADPYPVNLDLTIVRQDAEEREPDALNDAPIVAADSRTGRQPDDDVSKATPQERPDPDNPPGLSGMELGSLIIDALTSGPISVEGDMDEADVVAPGELLSPREFEVLAERLGSIASVTGRDRLRADIEEAADLNEDARKVLRAALDEAFPDEAAQEADTTSSEEEEQRFPDNV